MKSILPYLFAALSLPVCAQISPLESLHSGHYLFNPTANEFMQANGLDIQRSASMKKLDSISSIQYDTWSTHWRNWTQTEFEYYPNGTLKSHKITTPQMLKEVVYFNTSGKISEQVYFQYTTNGWDSLQKTIFYYNTQNQQITDSTFVWNNTIWEPHGYTDVSYSLSGLPLKRVYYQKQTWSFEPIDKLTYAFDGNNNLTDMERFQFVNNQWTPRNYYHHTYNNQNQRIEYSTEWWDGMSYTPEYKEVFTYNQQNLTQVDMSFWNNGNWELNTYQTFQYNLLESNASIYLPSNLMHNENKLIAYQTHATTGLGTILTVDSVTFHYSNHQQNPNAIAENTAQPYRVLQNPVLNQLILNATTYQPTTCRIYSLTGQLMLEKPLTQLNEQINVSFLNTGIYIVQMQSGEATSSLRILKQ